MQKKIDNISLNIKVTYAIINLVIIVSNELCAYFCKNTA